MRAVSGILLAIFFLAGCSKSDINNFYLKYFGAHLSYTGFERINDELQLTLNVGVMNDRNLTELNRAEVEPILTQVSTALATEYPGIRIRFIVDQPLDAEYMMNTLTRAKREVGLKHDFNSDLLDLDATDLATEKNKRVLAKLKPQVANAMLLQLENLHKIRRSDGLPVLQDRNVSSLHLWRAFFLDQVRYDVILTNAMLYEDNPQNSMPVKLNPDGSIAWKSIPAPGRSTVERLAVMVSIPQRNQAPASPESFDILKGALRFLVFSSIEENTSRDSPKARTRVAYLNGIASYATDRKVTCEALALPVFEGIEPSARAILESARTHSADHCSRLKKD